MTLLLMILAGALQMNAQDSAYFYLDCPDDVIISSDNPAGGVFVELPLAVAYGDNEPFFIYNDYNEGGADASGIYLPGTNLVTFYATDSDSNNVSCSTAVTVISGNDSTVVPVIICPNNIYIFENDSFGNTMWVDVPEAVATSEAGIANISNSYNNGGADASDYYPIFETTSVIFTAIDINGNSVSCLTLITISLGGDSSDVYGCMDPDALNYNPLATIDDGSCIYEDDSTMITLNCPYEVFAPVNDSVEELHFVDVPLAIATSQNGTVTVTNDYNDGGADASGLYPFGITNVTYTATNGDNLATCITPIIVYFENDSTGGVYGCTDPEALNYNPQATIDDGSCIYNNDSTDVIYGCMDPIALNFNPFATVDDGSCIYYNDSIPECTAFAAFQFTQIDQENNFVEISNTSIWEGEATFFWDFGDGSTSDLAYPDHAYSEDGVYLVCLTIIVQNDLVVCEDTFCDSIGLFGGNKLAGGFNLSVIPSVITGIIETDLFNKELNLYPNPTTSKLNVGYSLNSNADVNITIYDLSGRIVDFKLTFGVVGENREAVDVSELQPGIYILELSANQRDKIISRFIINR